MSIGNVLKYTVFYLVGFIFTTYLGFVLFDSIGAGIVMFILLIGIQDGIEKVKTKKNEVENS